MTKDSEIQAVTEQIIAYLSKQPNASDSLEGIGQWGEGGTLGARRAELERALDVLVESGQITKHYDPAGKPIYTLKRKR